MHSEELHHDNSFVRRYEAYLSEFVYGGIDGCVTTFAVVAGAVGAGLNTSIILILGFANLLADGFSMSVGAYLSSKSERQRYNKHKKIEYWEIENIPEAEVEEVREIYRAKGFEGELLEKVVSVITSDKQRWVDEMMKNELEMIKEERSPILMGTATFISFLIVGLVPLTVYVIDLFTKLNINLFFYTSCLTALGFIFIGILKSYVTRTKMLKAIMETLVLGASAALIAYFVGDLLESIITSS